MTSRPHHPTTAPQAGGCPAAGQQVGHRTCPHAAHTAAARTAPAGNPPWQPPRCAAGGQGGGAPHRREQRRRRAGHVPHRRRRHLSISASQHLLACQGHAIGAMCDWRGSIQPTWRSSWSCWNCSRRLEASHTRSSLLTLAFSTMLVSSLRHTGQGRVQRGGKLVRRRAGGRQQGQASGLGCG